jgi:hypothetical protein
MSPFGQTLPFFYIISQGTKERGEGKNYQLVLSQGDSLKKKKRTKGKGHAPLHVVPRDVKKKKNTTTTNNTVTTWHPAEARGVSTIW